MCMYVCECAYTCAVHPFMSLSFTIYTHTLLVTRLPDSSSGPRINLQPIHLPQSLSKITISLDASAKFGPRRCCHQVVSGRPLGRPPCTQPYITSLSSLHHMSEPSTLIVHLSLRNISSQKTQFPNGLLGDPVLLPCIFYLRNTFPLLSDDF